MATPCLNIRSSNFRNLYNINYLHEEESFLEANSQSGSQERHHLLRNLKVHYRVGKDPSLDPALSLMNSDIHTESFPAT